MLFSPSSLIILVYALFSGEFEKVVILLGFLRGSGDGGPGGSDKMVSEVAIKFHKMYIVDN